MSLENTHDIGNVKIVMVGAGGGGASSLSDLSDTNISNPSNGQLLGYNGTSGKWENVTGGGGGGDSFAGLGIGKKKTVTSGVIDTDIDLHRAPVVGDRLLVYFDEKVTNPTGLTTYNNGTAVTSNLENAVSLYINAGWNILEFKNDGLLYDNCWVRVQNVPLPISTLSGLSDTLINSPSDDQLLVYDNGKWKNKKFIEANVGFPVTELRKIEVDGIVYDTDGMRTYEASNVANNKISLSVINAYQFVQKVIAVNTGAHSGSSNGWSLYISDGMEVANVALTRADGSAFNDDITENELLLIYVDTAGNVARVLDIPVNNTEIKTVSGNPITLTDALAGNAIEVSAEIVATQSGSGTPSPTNIRPISGFSSVTITREDAQGQTATVTVALGSTVYGGTLDLTSGELTVTHASASGKVIGANDSYTNVTYGIVVKQSDSAEYGNYTMHDTISSMFEIGVATSTGWDNVDKIGKLYMQASGDRYWIGFPKGTTLATMESVTNDNQIVYELATPTTTTLTAEQLALVKGYNQLSCNSGDMEITYKASGLDALKERVDELEDRVDDLTVSDLADTAITTPTNGQVLTFDSVTGKWGNQNPSGGNSMSKTRYTISSSSWSASANASGYYTYSLTLTTLLSTSYAPNIYISGASDSAFSTDTEKVQFSYLNECNLSASNTLVLYAKTKPTSTFYVYVEGQNA